MTFRWPARKVWIGLAYLGGLCAGALSACSDGPLGEPPAWYGYYYENIMTTGAPAISRPFPTAAACLMAMHHYTRNASPWSGYACGQGCQQQGTGLLSDCTEVVH